MRQLSEKVRLLGCFFASLLELAAFFAPEECPLGSRGGELGGGATRATFACSCGLCGLCLSSSSSLGDASS